jgi:preprotein translocase SecE subunit
VLHRPTEARLGRAIGLSLTTAIGAYLAYALHHSYGDGAGVQSPITVASLAILIFSGVAGFYFLFVRPATSDFVVEVEIECRKVTWPEWLTVRRSTGQVTVLMLFLLFFLFLVDIGLGYIRQVVM